MVQGFRSGFGVKRYEAKLLFTVFPDDEINGAIAQIVNAPDKKNRMMLHLEPM